MLGGDGSVLIFYILSAVTFVYFFIWSIADFADANGFVQVGKNFNSGKGAAGFFGLVTAIMMIAISFLAIINGILFYRRD
jgi:amino acid transporter